MRLELELGLLDGGQHCAPHVGSRCLLLEQQFGLGCVSVVAPDMVGIVSETVGPFARRMSDLSLIARRSHRLYN